MAKTKQDPLEKKLLMIGRIADKLGLESVEINESTGSIKMAFIQKTSELAGNKKLPLSKKDKEMLEQLERDSELDEMRHMDPVTFEDMLIKGEIKE